MKKYIMLSLAGIAALSMIFITISQATSSKSDVPVAAEKTSQTEQPDTIEAPAEGVSADDESSKEEDASDEAEATVKNKRQKIEEPCEKCRDKKWNW